MASKIPKYVPASSNDEEDPIPGEEPATYGIGSILTYTPLEIKFGMPFFNPADYIVGNNYTEFHGFPLSSFSGDTVGLRLMYSKLRDLHFFATPTVTNPESHFAVSKRCHKAGTPYYKKAFLWLHNIPMLKLVALDNNFFRPALFTSDQEASQLVIPDVVVKDRAADLEKFFPTMKGEYLDSYVVAEAKDYLPNRTTGRIVHYFNYDKRSFLGLIFEQLAYESMLAELSNVTKRGGPNHLAEFFATPLGHYNFHVTLEIFNNEHFKKLLPAAELKALIGVNNDIREQTTTLLSKKIPELAYEGSLHNLRLTHFAQLQTFRARIISRFFRDDEYHSYIKDMLAAGVAKYYSSRDNAVKRKAAVLEKNESLKKRLIRNFSLPTIDEEMEAVEPIAEEAEECED